MWAAIAFGKKWESKIDIEGKAITFNAKKSKNLAKSIASLDMSIHWLLGDDWCIIVKEGRKVLYWGDKSEQPKDFKIRHL